jgi:uroporphyrinogen III methyltransferase / synthase
MSDRTGIVYLVGSGPGSIAYLTIRAQHLLEQAEVLIYDALVDGDLLQLVPDRCLKLNVGKRGGQPSVAQAEVNELLVKHAQQGRRVVRLKSGDPFIFGRCATEIDALQQANCGFEVVPGISSALAAPLLAGIPLTDPVLSRCFAVLSAHDLEALDWQTLSQIDTLVILMGAKHLPAIVERLQQRGRSPQTPIAIVRWAGQPQQQIWTGTLATITQQTARQPLSPAVMIIGAVVGLRPYLQFPLLSEDNQQNALLNLNSEPHVADFLLPLSGKTILITRAAGQSSSFSMMLQQQGATVMELPALEIMPPSSWEGLDQAIAQLQTFDWLILTSTNGVDYFFERLAAQGKDARALAGVKIAVVGQKTAASLHQHGLQPDFIPPDFVADSLVTHFPQAEHLPGMKLLFPRVESGGREVLVQELTAKGAIVTEVAAYQSGCAQAIAPTMTTALQQGKIDIITFASSKTVQCFAQLVEAVERNTPNQGNLAAVIQNPAVKTLLSQICIASIGPQTSIACHRYFGRVDVKATEYTLEGLTQAIVCWATGLSPISHDV